MSHQFPVAGFTPVHLTTSAGVPVAAAAPDAAAAVQTAQDLFPGSALAAAGRRVRGLYIHVPFCFHKCHYCDFYSLVDRLDRQDAFIARMEEEIAWIGGVLAGPIETVFIGGGTPTLLAPQRLARLLQAVRSLPLAEVPEITVEANPETVSPQIAAALADARVDRVSIGAQSFQPALLKVLERHHDPASVGRAVGLLREAGIIRINLDLIFGIPGQSAAMWRRDLDAALALEPAHMSCYGLMYEAGTAMTKRLDLGLVERADEETEANMFETTLQVMRSAGFEHYEISNFARPGERCRHNMLYWLNGDWWPLGPAAAGHVGGVRWRNVPRLDAWLRDGPAPRIDQVERADPGQVAGERFMLGLRLMDGIDDALVEELLAAPGGTPRRAAIDRALREGLLERAGGRLKLTAAGLLLTDTILTELV